MHEGMKSEKNEEEKRLHEFSDKKRTAHGKHVVSKERKNENNLECT